MELVGRNDVYRMDEVYLCY